MRAQGLAAIAASASVLAAAGCGGSVDKAGFSSSDRAAAQVALGALDQTSVPTTLVVLTNTAGTVPAVCRVHKEKGDKGRFGLFILWRPSKRAYRGTYTWFRATLTSDVKTDVFRSGYIPVSEGEAQVLRAQAGHALERPSEPCEILMNGHLRLLST